MSERVRQSGFTLIEIMVVVALMAGVIALVAPRLASPNSQIRTAVRHLGTLPRILNNQARLRGMTYRIAIQISEKDGYKYWVESSPGEVRVRSEEQEKEFLRLTTYDQERQKKSSPFTQDKEFSREAKTLPSKIKFLEVEFKGHEKSITEGVTYIHFFPQGLAQEAAIHLGDGKKLHWTIAIRPLTGQSDIIPENVRLKDLQ